MSKHPKHVEGFEGTLDELAVAIGNMSYDQFAYLTNKLTEDLRRQADVDLSRGRKKLASQLYAAAESFDEARKQMDSVWKTCEPYMG